MIWFKPNGYLVQDKWFGSRQMIIWFKPNHLARAKWLFGSSQMIWFAPNDYLAQADKHLSVVLLKLTWYKFSLDFPVVFKNETFINVWQKLRKLAKYIVDSFIVYNSTGLLTAYLLETKRQAINNNVRYALTQYCSNVQPVSKTVDQHWKDIRCMPHNVTIGSWGARACFPVFTSNMSGDI